jgi:hypothetical protein
LELEEQEELERVVQEVMELQETHQFFQQLQVQVEEEVVEVLIKQD